MKKNILILGVAALLLSSCSYLDIVPDDVATMEMVFQTRSTAERALYTCYNYIPNSGNPYTNPGLSAGDEIWLPKPSYWWNNPVWKIAKGEQNTNDPILNYWSGSGGGTNLFVGIRDCNIFLENIDKVPDMEQKEKDRWKAEVKFVKAYLHIWLFQLYGSISYIDKNIDVAASPDAVKIERQPVDEVVANIVKLLDEVIAEKELPVTIKARATELGRATKPAAMALKARLLTYAASPLYNGNGDFNDFKDSKGRNLINPVYDPKKWKVAANACKEAIHICDSAGIKLYEFKDNIGCEIGDTTELELTLRATLTKKWNDELIWAINNDTYALTAGANPNLTDWHYSNVEEHRASHCPTLRVVEQFYSNNGIPISEDKSYRYDDRYDLVPVPANHAYYIDTTAAYTSRLFVNREPRFYAWIGFDRGKWFNLEVNSDKESQVLQCQDGETGGRSFLNHSATGFFAKKLVPYDLIFTKAARTTEVMNYTFPVIRLADLYLLYAECLNEVKDAPDDEVWEYVQKVRTKAGLDTLTHNLVDTWEMFSSNPQKPLSKEGMRDIIHQERLIELCFEGQRYYDLRRWKKMLDYGNRPIKGFNITSKGKDFYEPVFIYTPEFTLKDYFWPIRLNDIYQNNKLQQSPYWN